MFTEDQIRAAVSNLSPYREHHYVMPVEVDGERCELCRTERYDNGAGRGPIARLLEDCPDSEVVEWPAGFHGTMATSVAYALREAAPVSVS